MKITLHTVLGLKQVIGQRLTEIDLPIGSTVEGLIEYMREKWGDKLSAHLFDRDSGAVLPYVRIMVNGQMIDFLDGMKTTLEDGDEILILPLASGGSPPVGAQDAGGVGPGGRQFIRVASSGRGQERLGRRGRSTRWANGSMGFDPANVDEYLVRLEYEEGVVGHSESAGKAQCAFSSVGQGSAALFERG